jgi:glycogen synthase
MPPLSFFSLSENDRLASARRQVRAGSATVVYCVYENPFAMSGGIAAVAENYCAELVAQHRSVLAVTPLHGRLKTAPALDDLQYVGHCDVPFDSRRVQVELYEFRQAEVRWVLMGSDEFFQADGGGGGSDPYVYSSGAALLDDSLFASAAVPFALAALGLKDNLLVHLNDWETAATALTVKQAILAGIFKSAAVVLTSHNPYDCDVTLPDL